MVAILASSRKSGRLIRSVPCVLWQPFCIESFAQVVEWSITRDCKSLAFGLRGFKSLPAHKYLEIPARIVSISAILI